MSPVDARPGSSDDPGRVPPADFAAPDPDDRWAHDEIELARAERRHEQHLGRS